MNYGMSNANLMRKIQVTQNKIVKILFGYRRDHHNEDVFRNENILQIKGIYKLKLCSMVFDKIHNRLPIEISNTMMLHERKCNIETRRNKGFFVPGYKGIGSLKTLGYVVADMGNFLLKEGILEVSARKEFMKQCKENLLSGKLNWCK
jgi:hypothetical protein